MQRKIRERLLLLRIMRVFISTIFISLLIVNLFVGGTEYRTISFVLLLFWLVLSILQIYYLLKLRETRKTWIGWQGFLLRLHEKRYR